MSHLSKSIAYKSAILGLSIFAIPVVHAFPLVEGSTFLDLNQFSVSDTGTAAILNTAAGGFDVDVADPTEFSGDTTPTITSTLGAVTGRSSSLPTWDAGFLWDENNQMGTDIYLSQLSQGGGATAYVSWTVEVNGTGVLSAMIDYAIDLNVVNDTDGVYAEGLSEVILQISDGTGGVVDDIARMGNYYYSSGVLPDDAPNGQLYTEWAYDTCETQIIGTNPDGTLMTSVNCNPMQLMISVNAANFATINDRPGYIANVTPGTTPTPVPAPGTLYLLAGGALMLLRRQS
ncbi:MAG: hypothetical protein OEZ43_12580 [Gammaproteobacteria bacterium]|nr:hypothetical protein [Gammaproteobacteria bacterium]